MNSMAMYNNIHYESVTSRRSFETYVQNLSKSINSNHEANVNVNYYIVLFL
jgi:hypothetical protein